MTARPGLFAAIHGYVFGETDTGTDAPRAARAENHGTIHVSGSTVFRDEYDDDGNVVDTDFDSFTAGVSVAAEEGIATVLNTGNVNATGSFVAGLAATDDLGSGDDDDDDFYEDYEPVDVTVRMTGGSVTAGARDNPGTPEDESGIGFGIAAESDDGSVRVFVSGDSTTITAYGAKADAPLADYLDDVRNGIGIWASGDYRDDCYTEVDTCTSDTLVEISGGATVTADVAVASSGTLNLYESRLNGRVVLDNEFGGTNDRFTIRGGSVYGDVKFHGLDDVLTIKNYGYITGDVDFGEDELQSGREDRDVLIFDVNGTGDRTSRIDGRITGLEEMYKLGPGTAWVRDVTFSGSTLALEEGGLTLAGHLNLGTDGTLTVHDESRLTIEVGDITKDATDHGLITAGGGVIYEGLTAQDSPELFMQIGVDAVESRKAIQARLQQEETRIDVLGQDTNVLRRADADSRPVEAEATLMTVGDDGTAQAIGSLSDDGTAVVQCPEGQVGTPPNCTTPPPPKCPEGQVGTPPNCTTPPPPKCPEGQVGTPPNCTTPPPPKCPEGQVGTPPNCTTPPPPKCPEGQIGAPPNCTTPPPPKCPEGQVGTPPDCKTPPRGDDGGSSNAGAILVGGGAAAALAVYLFDLFDSEEPALVEYDESWTGSRSTTSFAGIRSGHFREQSRAHRRSGAVDPCFRRRFERSRGRRRGRGAGRRPGHGREAPPGLQRRRVDDARRGRVGPPWSGPELRRQCRRCTLCASWRMARRRAVRRHEPLARELPNAFAH